VSGLSSTADVYIQKGVGRIRRSPGHRLTGASLFPGAQGSWFRQNDCREIGFATVAVNDTLLDGSIWPASNEDYFIASRSSTMMCFGAQEVALIPLDVGRTRELADL
jgi:hypothetical protein